MSNTVELIPSLPLTLMDGRSVKLRLSHGAMIRFSRSTGLELSAISAGSTADKLEAIGRLLYECSDIRKSVPYDDFLEELDPVEASSIAKSLFERFAGGGKNGGRPSAESALTGLSGGQSGATSDSATPNSGDSLPLNSTLSVSEGESGTS